MSIFFYESTLGKLAIEDEDGFIIRIYFENEEISPKKEIKETIVTRKAFEEISKYLKGELFEFTVPIKPLGTAFMKEVWDELNKIPYGEKSTYKDIAEKCCRPKAYRAVGMACNRNPIPIIIPCHRVLGSNGKLIGYLGGLSIKKKLLKLESIKIL